MSTGTRQTKPDCTDCPKRQSQFKCKIRYCTKKYCWESTVLRNTSLQRCSSVSSSCGLPTEVVGFPFMEVFKTNLDTAWTTCGVCFEQGLGLETSGGPSPSMWACDSLKPAWSTGRTGSKHLHLCRYICLTEEIEKKVLYQTAERALLNLSDSTWTR